MKGIKGWIEDSGPPVGIDEDGMADLFQKIYAVNVPHEPAAVLLDPHPRLGLVYIVDRELRTVGMMGIGIATYMGWIEEQP